ncbi:hypothetical protein GOBAR_DD35684 [Gossypium barbadense]|nr:hypothetical protein GOBAR_DD35684 [Gossypium barbadense]
MGVSVVRLAHQLRCEFRPGVGVLAAPRVSETLGLLSSVNKLGHLGPMYFGSNEFWATFRKKIYLIIKKDEYLTKKRAHVEEMNGVGYGNSEQGIVSGKSNNINLADGKVNQTQLFNIIGVPNSLVSLITMTTLFFSATRNLTHSHQK